MPFLSIFTAKKFYMTNCSNNQRKSVAGDIGLSCKTHRSKTKPVKTSSLQFCDPGKFLKESGAGIQTTVKSDWIYSAWWSILHSCTPCLKLGIDSKGSTRCHASRMNNVSLHMEYMCMALESLLAAKFDPALDAVGHPVHKCNWNQVNCIHCLLRSLPRVYRRRSQYHWKLYSVHMPSVHKDLLTSSTMSSFTVNNTLHQRC